MQPEKLTGSAGPRTAFEYKEIGNHLFKEGKYDMGIEAYSNAIAKDPEQSIFYSNRAQCYYKLSLFTNCIQDAMQAISKNSSNIKAYVLSARARIKVFKETLDIKILKTAFQHCNYALAVYKEANEIENIKFTKELKRKLEAMKSTYKMIIEKNNTAEVMIYYQSKLRDHQDLLGRLEGLLEIPRDREYMALQCPITFECFNQPVVTSAGITYEESAIKEYLKRGNSSDPVTRKILNGTIFIVNRNIREVIKYLSIRHPWHFIDHQNEILLR